MNATYANITGQKPFETAVGNHLMQIAGGSGLAVTMGNCPYDFSFSGVNGRLWQFEVKNDLDSDKWNNWFVEYQYKGHPSCLSTTPAQYWVHYMPRHELLGVAKVEDLKAFISGSNFKAKPGGDGKQCMGHILPISQTTGQPFLKTIPFHFEQ